MTGRNEKIRSLFLTAIMVLSVFGGTIAFAGTAAAANGISSPSFSDSSPVNSGSTVTVSYDIGDLGGDGVDDQTTLTIDNGEITNVGTPSASGHNADVESTSTQSVTVNITDDTTSDTTTVDIPVDVSVSTSQNVEFSASAMDSGGAGDVSSTSLGTLTYVPDAEPGNADDHISSNELYWYGQWGYFENATAGATYELRQVDEDSADTSFETEITIDADGEGIFRTSTVDVSDVQPDGDFVIVDGNDTLVTLDDSASATSTGTNVDVASEQDLADSSFEISEVNLNAEFNQSSYVTGEPGTLTVESDRSDGYHIAVTSNNDNVTDGDLAGLLADANGAHYVDSSIATTATGVLPEEDEIAPFRQGVAGSSSSDDQTAVFFVSQENEDIDLDTSAIDVNQSEDIQLDFSVVDAEDSDSTNVTFTPTPETGIVYSDVNIDRPEPDEVGDNINVTFDLTADADDGETRRGYALLQDNQEFQVLDLLNLTDHNDDGQVKVQINTFRLGRGSDMEAGYSAYGNDTVSITRPRATGFGNDTRVVAEQGNITSMEWYWGGSEDPLDPPLDGMPGRDGIDKDILDPSDYQLIGMDQPVINLSDPETELEMPERTDRTAMTLQPRENVNESVTVMVAPRDSDDPLEDATPINTEGFIESDVVANHDQVIFQINAEGIQGMVEPFTNADGVTSAERITGWNGVHFFVGEEDAPGNRMPYYWDLHEGDNYVWANGDEDEYYMVVQTDDLEGVGSNDNNEIPNAAYRAQLVIAAGDENTLAGDTGGDSVAAHDDPGDPWRDSLDGTYAEWYAEGVFPDNDNFWATYADYDTGLPFDFVWNPYIENIGFEEDTGQELADSSIQLAQPYAEIDQFVSDNDLNVVKVPATENATVSGTTNLAPGSTFEVSMENVSAGLINQETVNASLGDGVRTWGTTMDFSDYAGTPFQARALDGTDQIISSAQAFNPDVQSPYAAGMVIAQDEGSLTFEDQEVESGSSTVTVQSVSANKGGFVAITNSNGDLIGFNNTPLEDGTSGESVEIALDTSITSEMELTATLYEDTDEDGAFDYGENGVDRVYEDTSDSATISVSTPETTTTQPPTTTTQPTTEPTTEPTPTDNGDGGDTPGFGVVVALLALVAAALLAVRRER